MKQGKTIPESLLKTTGIPVKTKEEKIIFSDRVEALTSYYQKNGHIQVKNSENKSLATFCYNARRFRLHPEKASMKLSEGQIAALDALNFEWNPLNRSRKSFSERLDQLRAFKEEHGHLAITKKQNRSLAGFCNKVRSVRKTPDDNKLKLTKENVSSLDELGFDWCSLEREPRQKCVRKSFIERVEDLKRYYQNGHLRDVNRKEDKTLAHFCSNVRYARKNPGDGIKLTEDRIASLDAIGFQWETIMHQRQNSENGIKVSNVRKTNDKGTSLCQVIAAETAAIMAAFY